MLRTATLAMTTIAALGIAFVSTDVQARAGGGGGFRGGGGGFGGGARAGGVGGFRGGAVEIGRAHV